MPWLAFALLLGLSLGQVCPPDATSLATWTWRSGAQTNPPGTTANTVSPYTLDIGQRFAQVAEDTVNGALVFGGQTGTGVSVRRVGSRSVASQVLICRC